MPSASDCCGRRKEAVRIAVEVDLQSGRAGQVVAKGVDEYGAEIAVQEGKERMERVAEHSTATL